MTQTDPPADPRTASASLTIDVRGLSCPLPVLKLNKTLKTLPAGTEFVLLATDPATLRDIPAYCASHGHAVETAREPDGFSFRIRKTA